MTREPSLKKRLFIYPFIGLLFAAFSCFIVYSALGFDIGFKDGEFTVKKTGLIILNTKPGDAKVYVDGKLFRKKTPAFSLFSLKIDKLVEGNHELRIEKEGYETWEGLFPVNPGLVSWGNYIILIPKERNAESFNLIGEITGSLSSPDKTKALVTTREKSSKIFTIFEIDLASKVKSRIYETYYKEGENYTLLSYSPDKQRFLVKKTIGDLTSYLVFENKDKGQIWDITKQFALTMEQVQFNPDNHNQIFALRNKNLYRIDYSSGQLSAVIETGVSDIFAENEELLFVQKVESNYGLWKIEQNGQKANVIKALPASESYQIGFLSEYNSYLVLNKKDKELFSSKTEGGKPVLKRIAENVEFFKVSPKDKFVGFKSGSDFYSYDFEKQKLHQSLKNKEIGSIGWFYDDYTLWYVEKERLFLVNYDGQYEKNIFNVSSGAVFTAPNSLNIFFIKKDEKDLLNLFSFSFHS